MNVLLDIWSLTEFTADVPGTYVLVDDGNLLVGEATGRLAAN